MISLPEFSNMYHLKEMSLSGELFLSCSILQLTFYAIGTTYQRKHGFVIFSQQIYYVGVLLISLTLLLFLNEDLFILNSFSSNNSITNDYLSFSVKLVVCLTSIIFFLVIKVSHKDEPLQNNFEFLTLVTISILGILLLCSSNDLITAYLAIELQSVAFYIMAAFKKNSSYSVDSGLKYFIIGSLSSAFFLFGSSLIYGCIGSLNFDDFKMFLPLLFIASNIKKTYLEVPFGFFEFLKDYSINEGVRYGRMTFNLSSTILPQYFDFGSFKHVYYRLIDYVSEPERTMKIFREEENLHIKPNLVYALSSSDTLLDWCFEKQINSEINLFGGNLILKDYSMENLLTIPQFCEYTENSSSFPFVLKHHIMFHYSLSRFLTVMPECLVYPICEQPYIIILNGLETPVLYEGLGYIYSGSPELSSISNSRSLYNFPIWNELFSNDQNLIVNNILKTFQSSVFSKLNFRNNLDYYNHSNMFSLLSIGFFFVFISLFIKLALSPFHFWSLDVYEGSPNVTSFFFLVVPKIGLLLLLFRICYLGFYEVFMNYKSYFIIFAVLSIFVGSLGGLEQRKIKSLLAYSSISHTGYLLLSFSSNTFEGMQMMFYYLVIYMLAGLCFWSVYLFLKKNSNNYNNKSNKELGDFILLKESNPILAVILAITLFSIAGIPPIVGFLAKIGIFLVVVGSSAYFVALISILFSVISTFYYIRFIKILYFENKLVGKLYHPVTSKKALIVSVLSMLLILLCIDPVVLYLIFYKSISLV